MMDLLPRPATQADLPALKQLLEDAGLITAGVRAHIEGFLLLEDEGRIVASAGLEQYGTHALLRSVAVVPAYRNRGVARFLVSRILGQAAAHQIQDVYLFTATAPAYFRRFGFVPITRDEVAVPVRASEEYGECCSGAETMVLRLRSVDEDQSALGANTARAQQ
jgi:N-acetylglutamate synthase-like GNAT family acetyltransferase